MKRRAVLSLPLALLAPVSPLKHYSRLRVLQGQRQLSQEAAITMLATFKKNFPEVRRWAKSASFIDNVAFFRGPFPKRPAT
jgi:hypothetical protein